MRAALATAAAAEGMMPADRSSGAGEQVLGEARARTPELHEMDAGQIAIYRAGYAAGRAAAAVKPPTAAEARMHLITALEAEARQLRAIAAGQRLQIAERADWLPPKGVL